MVRGGRGEKEVLMNIEPYKSDLLSNRRFKTPETSRESSESIWLNSVLIPQAARGGA
ncbi:DUF4385 family protein [Salibacterium qingdaonense]|uniref:DUF4385 family protein n=1 Tax=Salibacterium qingdaonense TaxID=266892 RepID=UPI002481CAB5|nr:DUF4385 family protein [Salibacterium qingdaonense]